MAIKRIAVSDNTTIPPKVLGTIVFNKDANGRLTVREQLPSGIPKDLVDSICIAVHVGIKNGNEGTYSWNE